ncbi:hypothetical protein BDQ17DRAFT_1332846 [Cyathus striatus]|nr:hypothetical protein BDQ17DRAFT_1332846 [Cyathus striatus]
MSIAQADDLPYDTVGQVLSHLQDRNESRRDYLACTLAIKTWTAPAKNMLLKSVVLDSQLSLVKFFKLLSCGDEKVLHTTQRLVITRRCPLHEANQRTLANIINILPCLRELSFDISNRTGMWETEVGSDLKGSIQKALSSTDLKIIRLTNIAFQDGKSLSELLSTIGPREIDILSLSKIRITTPASPDPSPADDSSKPAPPEPEPEPENHIDTHSLYLNLNRNKGFVSWINGGGLPIKIENVDTISLENCRFSEKDIGSFLAKCLGLRCLVVHLGDFALQAFSILFEVKADSDSAEDTASQDSAEDKTTHACIPLREVTSLEDIHFFIPFVPEEGYKSLVLDYMKNTICSLPAISYQMEVSIHIDVIEQAQISTFLDTDQITWKRFGECLRDYSVKTHIELRWKDETENTAENFKVALVDIFEAVGFPAADITRSKVIEFSYSQWFWG